MATIVQNYGPIYGEVVNGTVQGRPNGSVYVPITNTISITNPTTTPLTIRREPTWNAPTGAKQTNVNLKLVAVSQDLSSYMKVTTYSDSDLTTVVGSPQVWTAGTFNGTPRNLGTQSTDLVQDATYYIIAELMNNGVAVATSDILEATGVDH